MGVREDEVEHVVWHPGEDRAGPRVTCCDGPNGGGALHPRDPCSRPRSRQCLCLPPVLRDGAKPFQPLGGEWRSDNDNGQGYPR